MIIFPEQPKSKKAEQPSSKELAEHYKEVQEEKSAKRTNFWEGFKNLSAEKFKNSDGISVFIDQENN